ncbi:GNAT family N-acetyltransferase [Streptomyces sp. NPDC058372]|uniref:GNAT family N-acetyltransferase n=1 Tax=Streptomyces sp. NPDC058372 TaxID=3346464 RepID=UPI00366352A1
MAGRDRPDPLLALIDASLDHLRPWMPWASEQSPERTRAFLADCDPLWEAGDAYNYAITTPPDGTLTGSCSLYRAPEGSPAARLLGYWLHPAATGRGLATRAAAALVTEAFTTLPGVAHVEIAHDAANTASAAVPRRLGFTEHRRQPTPPPRAAGDSGTDVVWRIERGAWAPGDARRGA